MSMREDYLYTIETNIKIDKFGENRFCHVFKSLNLIKNS